MAGQGCGAGVVEAWRRHYAAQTSILRPYWLVDSGLLASSQEVSCKLYSRMRGCVGFDTEAEVEAVHHFPKVDHGKEEDTTVDGPKKYRQRPDCGESGETKSSDR